MEISQALFLTVATLLLPPSSGFVVTLYEHTNFKGSSRALHVERCTNVFNINFHDKASSLVTPECAVIYDDMCCQGKLAKIVTSVDNLESIDFNDKLTSISPCDDYHSDAPHQIRETWAGHGQIMTRVAEGFDTVIYYSDEIQRNGLRSHSEYLRKLWSYVKNTYGDFGPEASRLFAFFHASVPTSLYGSNFLQSYFDVSGDCRNMIDFVGKSDKAWSKPLEGNDELDLLTHEVAHLVEWSVKGVHGSPSFQLWGDDTWAEIFTFDVYKALEYYVDKERWFSQVRNNTHNSPRPNTYWFRDWFYPLYKKYGGAELLNNYFATLSRHFPKKENGWEYERDINLGEFVHFYSGAAKADLRPIAVKAFSWDNNAERELYHAKQAFPQIIY